MLLGEPGTEQHRTRLGLMMLCIGIILLLWTWGSWIYRASVPVKVEGHATDMVAEHSAQRVLALRTSPLFLMVFFVLILAFLVGSFVVVRMIRRYRAALEHERPTPTASEDVWSMQRVPRDADEIDA